jgi:hypothetical protein
MTMSNLLVALRHSTVRIFGVAFGLVYLAVAISGWALTGLHGESELIIFHVNPLHNIIHTAIGLAALAGAARSDRAAAVVLTVLGSALGLVTVLGFLGLLDAMAMDYGIADPDNFLHLVSGAAALSAGLLSEPAGEESGLRASHPLGG